jgi:hypothetical protein
LVPVVFPQNQTPILVCGSPDLRVTHVTSAKMVNVSAPEYVLPFRKRHLAGRTLYVILPSSFVFVTLTIVQLGRN